MAGRVPQGNERLGMGDVPRMAAREYQTKTRKAEITRNTTQPPGAAESCSSRWSERITMATAEQNKKFTGSLLVQWPLDEAIDWIKVNLSPEDVFDEDELSEWATDRGFVKGGS